ncbi:MAG TPA: Smr/MutS family protein [Myxococcota bacterium]|nr:Smr/MutS family protein [Myxococcota bacterium]
MSARRRDGSGNDPADRAALEAALTGVKPLRTGTTRVPSRAGARPTARPHGESTRDEPSFHIVTSGERVEGVATGVDRAWLRRLRAGDVRVESRVDLHGLNARSAHVAIRRAIEAAYADGQRCVLVVHGRGLHSPEGPVLRAFLLRWLTESRVAPIVMAFASARPRDGGEGATYVLLRRTRT